MNKQTIESREGHYVLKVSGRRKKKIEVPPHMIFKLKDCELRNAVFHDHLYIRPIFDGALYSQHDVFEAVDNLASVLALKVSQNSSLDYLTDNEDPKLKKWSFGLTLLSSHLLDYKNAHEQQIVGQVPDKKCDFSDSHLGRGDASNNKCCMPLQLPLQEEDFGNCHPHEDAFQEITGGKVKNVKNMAETFSRQPENQSFIEVPKIELIPIKRSMEKFEGYIGHTFASRRELSSAGIHIRIKQNIEYDENCAYSLVLQGIDISKNKMNFSKDKGKAFVYCGQSLSVLCATGMKMVGGIKKKRRIYERKQSQTMNFGNLALMKNYINEVPVHISRSYNLCGSAYAPTFGYRYDGLYYIESVWSKMNKGCKEFRFKFRRVPDQPKSELYKRIVRAPLNRQDDSSNSDESAMSEFSSSSEED